MLAAQQEPALQRSSHTEAGAATALKFMLTTGADLDLFVSGG